MCTDFEIALYKPRGSHQINDNLFTRANNNNITFDIVDGILQIWLAINAMHFECKVKSAKERIFCG